MEMQNYQGFVNFLITLLLVTTFLIILARRLNSVIVAVIIQGLLLVALSATLGWTTGIHEMYIAAVLTLVVKVVIIPVVLIKAVNIVAIKREVESFLNMKMTLLFAVCLVFISYLATGQVIGKGSGLLHGALPVAVSLMLIGLFLMINLRFPIMQIVGLFVMENGIFLAGIGTTIGMPLVIELGIFMDIMVGVLIMGVLVFRINQSFDIIDRKNLRNLRG
ncbi:hydrogenase [Desulfosporosinus sp. BICA1-9]|uniref:hydrogenase n=1 Tax=Desulfosporosinus sp. BICA1-9 TaxID=1531958 RepID=UPI00054C1812|nr:hydrogenase [Desulfosporosinus sp. BICA1-9]KJS50014.1 MAG: hydrogenase [Peptococcaceae bacterium BRH_c23]KJS80548.1 MAG: hydrogenase [Desulfosporosinus sp. BICA1-9]KJS89289.1 MAG: hydrogenase [Desulfosporosinus sp. BICA1-9]HBW38023.1 hydrogenase [Desulfosporosinus sp.]